MQLNQRFPFGKYKDQPLAVVDTQYIVWALNRANIKFDNPTLTKALMRELHTRLEDSLEAVVTDMAVRPTHLTSKAERLKHDREKRMQRAVREQSRKLQLLAENLGMADLV